MMAVRVPEMRIEEDEAKNLATCIANVERHYPRVSALFHGKVADHVALGTAIVSIYGTRFAVIGMRIKSEKEAEANPMRYPSRNNSPASSQNKEGSPQPSIVTNFPQAH
jgi:ArsR family metal-binding transcriptional regulator